MYENFVSDRRQKLTPPASDLWDRIALGQKSRLCLLPKLTVGSTSITTRVYLSKTHYYDT